MNLGASIISESSARGLRGMYFDFDGYGELRRVDYENRLREFLNSKGYRDVVASEEPSLVVDALEKSNAGNSSTALLLFEPLLSFVFYV
ncbi:MAG: hypothetical protein AAGD11_03075 [Planctomycetota bacterium]